MKSHLDSAKPLEIKMIDILQIKREKLNCNLLSYFHKCNDWCICDSDTILGTHELSNYQLYFQQPLASPCNKWFAYVIRFQMVQRTKCPQILFDLAKFLSSLTAIQVQFEDAFSIRRGFANNAIFSSVAEVSHEPYFQNNEYGVEHYFFL